MNFSKAHLLGDMGRIAKGIIGPHPCHFAVFEVEAVTGIVFRVRCPHRDVVVFLLFADDDEAREV